ncbi:hypothetical protein TWF730_002295 [Orbilia blumenaviensis]|uniref:Yeast cell wall synthesis Kre9/Knh1-like N-terminal domain-containing protein n=1 Tax=Orbilia blumenaviensis TaxID=1796055 RepID=A0AAV9UA70_9PEZI
MLFFKSAVSFALAALAAVASAQPSTRGNAFTSPAPGDVILPGDTFDIKWMNPVGDRVTLVVMDGASNSLTPIATIVTNIPNTGTYTWTVPDDLPRSGTYTIRISYDNTPANYNYSDRFTLNSDVIATPSVSTGSSSAASSTSAPASSTSAPSTTSESSSSETESSSSTTVRTSTSTRRSTTSESTGEPTSQGAPPSAGTTTLSSPLAVIMAVLAATLFIH